MQIEGAQAHHPRKFRLRQYCNQSPLLHRQPKRKQTVVPCLHASAHKVPQNNPKVNMECIRLCSLVHKQCFPKAGKTTVTWLPE